MRRRGGARRRAYYRLVRQALSKTALQRDHLRNTVTVAAMKQLRSSQS